MIECYRKCGSFIPKQDSDSHGSLEIWSCVPKIDRNDLTPVLRNVLLSFDQRRACAM